MAEHIISGAINNRVVAVILPSLWITVRLEARLKLTLFDGGAPWAVVNASLDNMTVYHRNSSVVPSMG